MDEFVDFRLRLTGDTADRHEFRGYDGYMALAGFAWTLSLVTNYAETGVIRQRGDFLGREAVFAQIPQEGSILADFSVWLRNGPSKVFGLNSEESARAFLYDLVNRVIGRNIGFNESPKTEELEALLKLRGGDIEALVVKAEPSVRQTHGIIGIGANKIDIIGGHNIIKSYDQRSQQYVKSNYEDKTRISGNFSVAAFNVNSGYGSVFDNDLHRTVPISMPRAVLHKYGSVFTWGLDQYANGTGLSINMNYTRLLAMDDTPKRYIVSSASRARSRA